MKTFEQIAEGDIEDAYLYDNLDQHETLDWDKEEYDYAEGYDPDTLNLFRVSLHQGSNQSTRKAGGVFLPVSDRFDLDLQPLKLNMTSLDCLSTF